MSRSTEAPCARAAGTAHRCPSVPGPAPQMTSCGAPVAIDASIAANVPMASIETSTSRMRGSAAAASTHATLAELMRKNAQLSCPIASTGPPKRGGRAHCSASVANAAIWHSASVRPPGTAAPDG